LKSSGEDIVRTTISAILCIVVSLAATAQTASTPAQGQLERGLANYRSGNYHEAVTDLQAAAQGFLTPEDMRSYVESGKLPTLSQFETALVYLAMAQTRLGREDDARSTILRLVTAERIEPTYASLVLPEEAREFEGLAARLVPSAPLNPNAALVASASALPPVQVAQTETPTPLPVVTPATQPPPAVTITEVAPVPAPTPAPAPAPAPVEIPAPTAVATRPEPPVTPSGTPLVVQPTIAQERAERQRIIEELVAQERVRIEREANERIAAAERAANERTAAAQREAAERTAAAEREAQQRIASTQQEAQTRIAAAEQRANEQATTAQREAETRIATARREAEERAAVERATQERLANEQAERRRTFLTSLRQADAYAMNEKLSQANEIYNRVAQSENAPREFIGAAAVGLYRTGAFRDAVKAFARLAPYARGEEDLRYYHAVSLYETGQYNAAQKELACALPFIQTTEDVTRYRAKIEQTVAQTAAAR
jgi:hypothetical protein